MIWSAEEGPDSVSRVSEYILGESDGKQTADTSVRSVKSILLHAGSTHIGRTTLSDVHSFSSDTTYFWSDIVRCPTVIFSPDSHTASHVQFNLVKWWHQHCRMTAVITRSCYAMQSGKHLLLAFSGFFFFLQS